MKNIQILFLLLSMSSFLHGMEEHRYKWAGISACMYCKEFKESQQSVAVFEFDSPANSFFLDEYTLMVYTDLILPQCIADTQLKRNYLNCRFHLDVTYEEKIKTDLCETAKICNKTVDEIRKEAEKSSLKTIRLQPTMEQKLLALTKIIITDDILEKIPTLENIEICSMPPLQMAALKIEIFGKTYEWNKVGIIQNKVDKNNMLQGAICMAAVKKLIPKYNKYNFDDVTNMLKKTNMIISQKKFDLIPEMIRLRAPKVFELMQ